MDHQEYMANVALEIDPATGRLAYDEILIIGPRQNTGKALDLATLLWTQRGWVSMGEIRTGDQVVHPDGHPIEVTFASEVMYGHACYRVLTSDGRSVVADAEHLWRVRDTYCGGARPWRTMTTAQIAAAGLRNRGVPGGWRFRLPVQHAVKTPDVVLPLDPYLLGVWLGDGTTKRAEVTSADPEVFEAFAAAGFEPSYSYETGRAFTRGLRGLVTLLRRMAVLGDKHVPDQYLTAGHDQRLALLQGLMDTDGCITENHGSTPRCEFTSTKRVLADAVLLLARSLGWRATLIEGRASLAGRDCGPKWRVAFTATTDDPVPFRLPRKARMLRAAMPRTGKRSAVSIAAIEPVKSRPVRCIKVASPDGLFLAGRGLVATHNTEFLLPYLTHRCIEPWFGPDQRVLQTAQTAEDARQKWRDIYMKRLQRVRAIRAMFTPRLSKDQEAFMWRNGSMWSPGSTTGKTAGTGDTLDVGFIDEAWSRPDFRTELGMKPAMDTRDNSQLLIASMIPGLTRAVPGTWPYLKEKRRFARARVEAGARHGVALFDWSAVEGSDPGDPRTWYSCMPGLGVTVREERIRAHFEKLPLVDFCAEFLGWEPKETVPMWTTIPQLVWNGLEDPDSAPVGTVALAAEITKDRQRGYLGSVGKRDDGHWHLEVIEPGQKIPVGTVGVDWMERRALEILAAQEICTTVIDKRRPSASLIQTIKNAGYDVTEPNGPDIQAACGRFYDRTGAATDPDAAKRDDGTRVRHLGQESLDRAVALVKKIDVGAGAFTFVDRGSDDSIGPLYLMVLGMLGVEMKWTPPVPDPEIFY